MTPLRLRHRLATWIVTSLLRHSGMGALLEQGQAEQNALVDGLRTDHEAAVSLLGQACQQLNRVSVTTNGLLLKHQAYEAASKPLMTAARQLTARAKRAADKRARASEQPERPDIAPAPDVSSDTAEGAR